MLTVSILALVASTCLDAKADSLFTEVGDGSTLTREKAKQIQSEAYRVIDGSDPECESSMQLEDLAFDMGTLLESKVIDTKRKER